jgi:hypothetical protein
MLSRLFCLFVLTVLWALLVSKKAFAAETEMVLYDNIKLVTRTELKYPKNMLANIRWAEELCKNFGTPVVAPFKETDLEKVFGKETTIYMSGSKSMWHERSWSLAWLLPENRKTRQCDFSLVTTDKIQVRTDEKKISVFYDSNGGETEVINFPPSQIQRYKQERESRLSQLSDPNSMWGRRMFAKAPEVKMVNGIPCAMTANGLGCLYEKMRYHIPTNTPLTIYSELGTPPVDPSCEDIDALRPLGVFGKSMACAITPRLVAVEIKTGIVMPPDIFEIPKAAKGFPIKYLN